MIAIYSLTNGKLELSFQSLKRARDSEIKLLTLKDDKKKMSHLLTDVRSIISFYCKIKEKTINTSNGDISSGLNLVEIPLIDTKKFDQENKSKSHEYLYKYWNKDNILKSENTPQLSLKILKETEYKNDDSFILNNIFYLKAENKLLEYLEHVKSNIDYELFEKKIEDSNNGEFIALDNCLLNLYLRRVKDSNIFSKIYDLVRYKNYLNEESYNEIDSCEQIDKSEKLVLKSCYLFSKNLIFSKLNGKPGALDILIKSDDSQDVDFSLVFDEFSKILRESSDIDIIFSKKMDSELYIDWIFEKNIDKGKLFLKNKIIKKKKKVKFL
jgi:hypothetical protein